MFKGKEKGKGRLYVFISLFSIMMLLVGWIGQAHSQEKYPTRAIEIIYPFAAGGAGDIYSRIATVYLKQKWGVPVNVVNKPGGNTIPGNLELYNARPDGYTIMADCNSSTALLKAGGTNVPFEVMDRVFMAMLAYSQNVFYVPASSNVKNMKDLAEEIKKAPEQFTWASWGTGSYTDYGARLFFKEIGADVLKTKPVLSKGTGEAISLVAGGHVKCGVGTVSSVAPALQSKVARAIGITGSTRDPNYPDVMTMAEQGYPSVNWVFWLGFTAPPKTPSHISEKWNEATREIVKNPEFLEKLKKAGALPLYLNAKEFKEYVAKEVETTSYLWPGK